MLVTSSPIGECKLCTKSLRQHHSDDAHGRSVVVNLHFLSAGQTCLVIILSMCSVRCAATYLHQGRQGPLQLTEPIPHHVSQPFVPRVFGFRIHKSSPYHATIVTS